MTHNFQLTTRLFGGEMRAITRELAEWAAGTSYKGLSGEVKEKAKFCMLDCAGVILAAVKGDPDPRQPSTE